MLNNICFQFYFVSSFTLQYLIVIYLIYFMVIHKLVTRRLISKFYEITPGW